MTIQAMTDAAILQDIGARIARYRLNRNMTQEALAKEAGVSLPTINRLEKGHSTQLTSFLRVLRVLNIADNLDALIPGPVESPLQKLKMQGKKRRRASGTKDKNDTHEWSWDEDK